MLTRWMDALAGDAMVGLDVGPVAIALAELSRSGGDEALRLRRWAIEPRQSKDVSQDLRQLWKRIGLAHNHVAVGLASPELIVKPFEFPKMPRRDLDNAIRLEAEQSILNGHSLNEMAMDWNALTASGETSVRGVLSIVSKAFLSERLNAIRAAGLAPRVADVEALAVWNAWWTWAGHRRPAGQTVLVMNIGVSTTNVVIAVTLDHLVLVRDLQLGSEAFGVGAEGDWAMELRDSLAYARSTGGVRDLDAVVVTGAGAVDARVLPLVQRATTCERVERWNPSTDVACEPDCPPLNESNGMRLVVALGLALRQAG